MKLCLSLMLLSVIACAAPSKNTHSDREMQYMWRNPTQMPGHDYPSSPPMAPEPWHKGR